MGRIVCVVCFYIKLSPLTAARELLAMSVEISTEQPVEIAEQQRPNNKPQTAQVDPSNKPSHLLYAVEMLAFAVVGWAWLAVRELMGDTPVMDVAVLLSVLVSSVINLVMALLYYTTEQFKNPAQAFLNHAACVWLLYAFSLLQSTTDGRSAICCIEDGAQKSLFSLRLTYRQAYFGGLTLHQSAAAITLSFLTIFLILASAQARVCTQSPREWPMAKAPLAVVCLLCLQQAMLGIMAPVCKDKDISNAVLAFIVIALVLMLDTPWLFAKLTNGGQIVTSAGIDVLQLLKVLQCSIELVLTFLIGVMAAVLGFNLGSGDALTVCIGVALLWQLGGVIAVVYEIRNPPEQEKEQATTTPSITTPTRASAMDTATAPPTAPPNLATHFRQPYPPPMLLPVFGNLRRAHDRKAL